MKEMIYDPAIKDVVLLDNGTYKDFEYYIVNHGGKYPLAYIKVPDDLKISCENPFKIDLDSPHGGLTFGCENDVPPVLEGIASKGNYLGWDYAYIGDWLGYYNPDSFMLGRKWTTKEILEQVKNTIEEIRNGNNSGRMIGTRYLKLFKNDIQVKNFKTICKLNGKEIDIDSWMRLMDGPGVKGE